jgi:hypothetical protein
VQNFDTTKNAFSNPVSIYNDPNGNFPGWPFFTPDSAKVIFALSAAGGTVNGGPAGSNFASLNNPPVQASAADINSSDLYVVNLAMPGQAMAMNLANGFRNGKSYLPYAGRDEHYNFYPTGSPIAAGGYFWVFFTSRRNYGNVMTDSMGNVPDPVFNTETKKLWVTAITIDSNGDPSHPAFYLPGQEAPSGNIRAFAALAPCRSSGSSCTAGIDCCGGYCTNGKCGMPASCSALDNKCTTDADCCPVDAGAPLKCYGGFCGTPPPQ